MTTIAFRDGILASDSLVSSDEQTRSGYVEKITKITVVEQLSFFDRIVMRREPKELTYLVGYAGAVSDALEYIDCIFKGAPQEKNVYECHIIAVREIDEDDGYEVTIFDGHSTKGFKINYDYHSIGSGSPFAQGAMYYGASAPEAVEAAINFDTSSGGEIRMITFDDGDDHE